MDRRKVKKLVKKRIKFLLKRKKHYSKNYMSTMNTSLKYNQFLHCVIKKRNFLLIKNEVRWDLFEY